MITVFTPTYNRAYILPKLFESLLIQSVKDFEWMIVDDGSTDNTRHLIDEFRQRADFRITYIYQENQGKHVAINTALKLITTPYFLTVDSDDYVLEGSITRIYEKIDLIAGNDEIIGFVCPIKMLNRPPTKYSIAENTITTSMDLLYRYKYRGELTMIFKTWLARGYKYPVFKDEKFIQESLVYNRMDKNYQLLFSNQNIIGAEYLGDGLTAQGKNLFFMNPKGSALTFCEKMNNRSIPYKIRKVCTLNYWDYETLNDNCILRKLIKIQGLPLKLFIIKYLIKKLFKNYIMSILRIIVNYNNII